MSRRVCDGANDGLVVGTPVGLAVGMAVGTKLGVGVGLAVGALVGRWVGLAVARALHTASAVVATAGESCAKVGTMTAGTHRFGCIVAALTRPLTSTPIVLTPFALI